MKIDPANINNPAVTPASTPVTGTTRADTNRITTGPGIELPDFGKSGKSKDQVQISNLLDSLRRAAVNTDEITPERAAHLDKLAAAVQGGTYEVDAHQLSSRIVDDTLKGIG